MGLVAKQSVWNTIILYAGVIIGYLNVTIFFPRVIGAEGYGLTRVILSVVFIAQHFALLGTPSMIMRYFPRFKDVKGRGLIPYALVILISGLIIVSGVLLWFQEPIIDIKREQSPLMENFYFLTVPILIFNAFYLFLSNICRVNMNTSLPLFVNDIIFKILTTLLLGLTWWYDWSLDFFLFLWAAAYAMNGLILLVWLLSKGLLKLGLDARVDRLFRRESMDFSFFSMMAGASNSVVSNIDVLMVGLLLAQNSLEMAGVYAIMVYLGNAILMPTRGLGTIASPLAAQYAENREDHKTAELYESTSRNQMITVGFLLIGVFINLPSLFVFMQVDYSIGMPVFALIGLARLVQSSTGINGVILVYSPYYRYTTYFIFGLAIVSIMLNYLMIPVLALTGAALASFISIVGFEFLKWLFVWKRLSFQPFHRRHVLVIALGLVLLLIGHFLPRVENIWIDMVYRSTIVTILAGLMILKFNISKELRQVVYKGLSMVGIRI
ncbi:MAG: polysaccharide biosynthesis protein [Flavobacteriales bacterium]|nr:polysaccharide biosynthesis protein [Flavobacteriales bacterium]